MVNPTPLDRAKEAAGGVNALARKVGVSSQAISQWPRVPARRVLAVEAATNGQVSRYELRPDIYGNAPANDSPASEAA